MWPRVAEIVIGLWLIASPWMLDDGASSARINVLICGSAVVLLSGLSFWPAMRRAHLGEIPIGVWLLGFAYFGSTHPAPPLVQSEILAALFVLNFAIIPSQTNLPPRSWQALQTDTRQMSAGHE